MNKDCKEYAPVLIATLNRYEHLKRLVDSLVKNPYAEYTSLYLSIDYPPSDKYVDGYNRIKTWINEKKIDGFLTCHIFFQKENLGWESNFEFLINQVREDGYDRFIVLEDDNEVSPNFLEYINKGLDLFLDNKKCMAICGYSADLPWITCGENVFAMSTAFAEWGYGIWFDRWDYLHETINREHLTRLEKDKEFTSKLYVKSLELYSIYFKAILTRKIDKSVFVKNNGEIRYIDYTIRMIMVEKDLFAIHPLITKVRNHGFDGSGVNCVKEIDDVHSQRVIDISPRFEYRIKTKNIQVDNNNESVYNLVRFEMEAKQAKNIEKMIDLFGIPITRKIVHMNNIIKSLKRV